MNPNPKCDSCYRKQLMQKHLEANQFEAVKEIYDKYCRNCTSHRFPPIPQDYYEEAENE